MTPDQVQAARRALFKLKSTPPSGSEHYRAGFDAGVESSITVIEGMKTAPAVPIEHHYVMTLCTMQPGGLKVQTDQDLYDWYPDGRDEQDVYYEIFNRACQRNDVDPSETSVMFWSIKPNQPVHPTTT